MPGDGFFDIYHLTPADWERAQRSTALFWETNPPKNTLTQFLAAPQNIFLSAEKGGEPVGQLIGYILPRWDSDQPMLFLYSVDVAAPHRRQGIARRLIETFRVIGRAHNCSESFVLTNESNHPAVQLYRSTGGKRENPDDVMFVYDP